MWIRRLRCLGRWICGIRRFRFENDLAIVDELEHKADRSRNIVVRLDRDTVRR